MSDKKSIRALVKVFFWKTSEKAVLVSIAPGSTSAAIWLPISLIENAPGYNNVFKQGEAIYLLVEAWLMLERKLLVHVDVYHGQ